MRRVGILLVLALLGIVSSPAQAVMNCELGSVRVTRNGGKQICVNDPVYGGRWVRVSSTTTTTTTTTTVPSAPIAPSLSFSSPSCGTVELSWSGFKPDTGWYSVQFTGGWDPDFRSYFMRNVREPRLRMGGFQNGGRYFFRVFVMRADWDGYWHRDENVTPHSNVLDVALESCAPPATTTTTTTTLPVASCAGGGTCVVGDTGPGGGIVFYVNPSGFACGPTLASTCKYLEAAPTSGTSAWSDTGYQWSAEQNTAVGADASGTAVGTGYKNTQAMLAQNSTAGYAGTVSRAYRGPNNLSDWYLPSKDELNALFAQRATVGGFSPVFYSTSTEFSGTVAWMQAFTTGAQTVAINKANFPYVRPIRAFG